MNNTKLLPFIQNGKALGQFYEDDFIYLFFGNFYFQKEHFLLFPNIQFQTIHQIHSNQAVFIEKLYEQLPSADAHYTNKKSLALAIQTADCLPILSFDVSRQWILAIHAGWRGVENHILARAIEKVGRSSNSSQYSFFVGPHIQQQSFEVQKDVADLLKKCSDANESSFQYHIVRDRYFVNLKEIVCNQIQQLPIKTDLLFFSEIDTMKNPEYASFRRLQSSCRNWSFIYLK